MDLQFIVTGSTGALTTAKIKSKLLRELFLIFQIIGRFIVFLQGLLQLIIFYDNII